MRHLIGAALGIVIFCTSAQAEPSPMWGINAPKTQANDASQVTQLNIGYSRASCFWSDVQPVSEAQAPNWSACDNKMHTVAKNLVVVTGTPNWAKANPACAGRRCRPDPAKFSSWAAKLAERYREGGSGPAALLGSVIAYEIWNEPRPFDDFTPEQFNSMVAAGSRAIKAQDPTVMVGGGAFEVLPGETSVGSHKIMNYFCENFGKDPGNDFISAHLYVKGHFVDHLQQCWPHEVCGDGAPNQPKPLLPVAQRLIKSTAYINAACGGKPLWITESGYSIGQWQGNRKPTYPVTDVQQRQMLPQILITAQMYARTVFLFNLNNTPGAHFYGIADKASGSLDGFRAVRTMSTVFDSSVESTSQRHITSNALNSIPASVDGYGFTGSGTTKYALWTTTAEPREVRLNFGTGNKQLTVTGWDGTLGAANVPAHPVTDVEGNYTFVLPARDVLYVSFP